MGTNGPHPYGVTQLSKQLCSPHAACEAEG
jgi:hypothetical protein